MQGLLNAQQSGRNVDMSSILKHKLSCVPLSLSNTDDTINSNSKSALLGILSTGIEIYTAVLSSYVSNAMVGACVLIDGHALIQNLGKQQVVEPFQIMQTYFKINIFPFQSRSSKGRCSI